MSKSSAKLIVAVATAVVVGAGYAGRKAVKRLFKKKTAAPVTAEVKPEDIDSTTVPLEKTDDCWAADQAKPITGKETGNKFVSRLGRFNPFKKKVA
jgi:hypothetical protein